MVEGESTGMTRVRCSTAAVLLLAATLLPGVAKAETVRIARQFGISYLPLVLMQEAGLLEQEGRVRGLDLTVDWISFTGGPPINDALISGSIDLAAGGVGPMLTLWGRTRANLRVKGIAALCSMPIWLNTNNPAVRTIADFTERDRIALPGVKVSIQAVVLQMAALQAFGPGQQNRLDPLTVSMGHPDGQAALLRGRTEITAHFTAAPYMYAEAASPGVHRVLDSYDVLGGPHTFNLVWATTRYHDGHPEVLAAFMAALGRAMAIINEQPLEAAAAWVRSEHARLSPAEAAEMIRDTGNEWTTTPRRMMAFATFMHAAGGLTQRPERWQDLFFPAVHAQDGS